jgi:archaeosine-15-forming tRNA-guanine transglycosylase
MNKVRKRELFYIICSNFNNKGIQMDTLTKTGIASSIIKQLNLESDEIILELNNIIKNTNINNYESIKLLSKIIKEYLKNKNIIFQHSKILNILSKSLGYQNHHSLKHNLNNLSINKIEIDIDNDSILKKFFLIKKEFMNKFNIEQSYIGHFFNRGQVFDFIYHKRGMGLRSKEKIEINKYLKSYSLKPYKNTILLCKIKHKDIQTVAFNILQQYRNFFIPIWYENDSNYSGLVDIWPILSHSKIEHIHDLILVDSYSSDLHWNIILSFLDYIFNFGTIEDVEFFENCLKEKDYNKHKRITKTLVEIARIYKWKQEQFLSLLIKNKKDTITETLDNIQYQIIIQEYMRPYIKELESISNKEIKKIIIGYCDNFFNLNKNYNEEDIENKIYLDFYNKNKEKYIEYMEKIDDIEIYRIYQDRTNSIKFIASEISFFIKAYKDIEKNYNKYYSLFRSKGY